MRRLAHVANHDGTPRSRGDRFFDPPDAAIGTLRTASTSIGRGWSDAIDVPALAVAAITGGTVAAAMWVATLGNLPTSAAIAVGVIAGIATCAFAYGMVALEHCSYVGSAGAWLVERRVAGLVKRRVLRYVDAWDVRVFTARTERRTQLTFTWIDESRRPVFVLTASYRGSRSMLPPHHPAMVGAAMVRAFDDHLAVATGLRTRQH